MTSARTRSQKMGAKYSFTQTPASNIGAPIFFWDGEIWKWTGCPDVWVLPNDFKLVKDPIVKMLAAAKGGAKLYSKETVTFDISDGDSFRKVTFRGRVYIVVSIPSAYSVWFGTKNLKVVGYLGYHWETQSSILCTVVGGGITYGAMSLNTKQELDDTEVLSDMPGYSPAGHVPLEEPEKRKMGQLLAFAKSHKTVEQVIESTMSSKIYPPVVSPEVITANAKELVDLAKSALSQATSPNWEDSVRVPVVVGGNLVLQNRHRSSVEVSRTSEAEIKIGLEDPFLAVRKRMNLKDGDPMPLPIYEKIEPTVKVIDWSVLGGKSSVAQVSGDDEEEEGENVL